MCVEKPKQVKKFQIENEIKPFKNNRGRIDL